MKQIRTLVLYDTETYKEVLTVKEKKKSRKKKVFILLDGSEFSNMAGLINNHRSLYWKQKKMCHFVFGRVTA